MKLKSYLCLIAGLFVVSFTELVFSSTNIADQRNIIFDRIGTDQGLSQGITTFVAQDPDGFVWVGTQEGLNRFDGFQFETYYHMEGDDSSLAHDYVRSFLFHNESMWVASDGGLDIFDPNSGTFSRVNFGQET